MEVDNVNASDVNSFLINEIHRADVIDLNKKRKLQTEHFGLPMPKLKCSDGRFPSKSLSTLDEIPEVEDLNTNVIEGGASDDGFEYDSTKSNNYAEDSDSSMCVHGESKFQAEKQESWSYDRPSSSSVNWGSNSLKGHCNTSDVAEAAGGDSGKEQFAFVGDEHHTVHHVDGLDEHLTEYGSHDEYFCLGYGHTTTEQFTEKEIEETIYSKEGNQNAYVLSSGRWSVNQEHGKRKPTIDQEFEQYFSSLML